METRLETRLEVTKLRRELTPLVKEEQTLIPTLSQDIVMPLELADGRISKTNIVLRGCTLGLLGHPFDIDLMPVELGSFDVIIGMDWLAKYHTLIVCDEKVVHIPYENEVLIIRGDNCDNETSYIQKADDKNGGDATEKVPTSTRISRIVPRHLPGLPPTRKLMNRLAIPLDEIQVDDKLNFIEEPVEIMDHEDKRLKQIRIPIVKEPVDLQDGP
ncbi:putative reverse transcriptase domain-containing protein [Tanacetum coccineum]